MARGLKKQTRGERIKGRMAHLTHTMPRVQVQLSDRFREWLASKLARVDVRITELEERVKAIEDEETS